MSGINPTNQLYLSEIVDYYIPGVSNVQVNHHKQACLICLDYHHHSSGVAFLVNHHTKDLTQLCWEELIDDNLRRSWKDIQEATEYGAVGIAILLVIKYTKYTIIERSVKGTGFDYYLLEADSFDPDDLFPQGTARLEVSGMIHAEKDSEINTRIREKKNQTKVSDESGMPALIIVVEFSRPEAHLVLRP